MFLFCSQIQFWAILLHTSYAIHADCGFPAFYNWSLIIYDFTHIALFSNFYYQTYSKKAKAARAKKLEQNGVHSNGTSSPTTKATTNGTHRSESDGVRQRKD